MPVPIGGTWLNSETMLWLTIDIHRELTRVSLEQDEIVFESPRLKIVAAPWSYAFTAKVDRILKPARSRVYDVSDAAVYLRHFIKSHGS